MVFILAKLYDQILGLNCANGNVLLARYLIKF